MNYKLLEPEITKSGFRFRQLIREGDIAIFHKVHLPSVSHPKAKDAGFEVVVIQKNAEYVMGGAPIEAKESLPGNEKWGSRGWTYKDLYSAEIRFQKLLNGDVPEETGEFLPDSEEEPTVEVTTPEEPKDKVIPPWPKSLNRETIKFPEGNFTKNEFADLNGIQYSAAHPAIENMLGHEVEFVGKREKTGKGKKSSEYRKKA